MNVNTTAIPLSNSATSTESRHEDWILGADRVHKTYVTAAGRVDALRDVSLDIGSGGRRGDGSLRLGKDHAVELPIGARLHRWRRRLPERNGAAQAVRCEAKPAPGQGDGLYLPVVQPDPRVQCGRERRAATSTRGRHAIGCEAARRGNAGSGGAGWSSRPPPQRAVGRRAAACDDRSRPCRTSIVWADEPTGNLDTETAESVMALMRDLNRDGLTLVLVTHDPAIGKTASRLVRMRDGRIEGEGEQ
jgi:hypothetical protein